ncbi:MAG: hypothetical protein BME93_02930 [Methanosarcinales archaeon Met12]|nr:MAG: hypothetical protein BME93_02930 [Methanosarcinales archaeon Met12]
MMLVGLVAAAGYLLWQQVPEEIRAEILALERKLADLVEKIELEPELVPVVVLPDPVQEVEVWKAL